MDVDQHDRAELTKRYTQLRLTGLLGPVALADLEHTLSLLYELVDTMLSGDSGNEELALIALDRDQLGYLTRGHVAAILNWVETRRQATGAHRTTRCMACRRVLTDDASRRRGYGPVCWQKRKSRTP